MTLVFSACFGMSMQAMDSVIGQVMVVNLIQHQMKEWCAFATILPALLFLW